MQVLNCKQHCAVELAITSGRDEPFDDFLPSHFNYLQFSYYNSESCLFQPVPRSVRVLCPVSFTVMEAEFNPKPTEIYSIADYVDGQIYWLNMMRQVLAFLLKTTCDEGSSL